MAGRFPIVTDVVGNSSLANDLHEFIAQATQIVDAVEKKLIEIEANAEKARQEAKRVVEDFIERVEALLLSGRAATLRHHENDQAWNAALGHAYEDMKRIGDALDTVKAILSGQPRQKYFQLRPFVIDGVYLHLMQRNLAASVWDKTEANVRRVLVELRTSLDLPLHRLDG